MKNSNLKTYLIMLLAISLLLGACAPAAAPAEVEPVSDVEEVAPTEEPAHEPTAEPEPTEIPAPVFEPVELVDVLGNTVLVETQPIRIVSLAPSITETLYIIGAGDLVVGRTDYDTYPEAVLEVESVGGFSADSISIETIISLEPDLVIGGSARQGEVTDALNESGIPSVIFEQKSVQEIMGLMLLLGDATGTQESAAAAVEDMETRLSEVASVVETIPEEERVTVFYEVWHEPLMTTTNQTFIGELINLAGGQNIFADLEENYPAVSAETIIEADPDVILGPSSHGDQLSAEMIAAREGWSEATAVTNESIYIIEGDIISRAGPRVIDALEVIAASLYPTYFEN
ncbi:MAG: cobalamin-binding protein [Chloroflexi bacterium]|nr:cobalamin-binding protein [Chloroflexota bacterium]